jgi:hypothetical protein
VWDHRAYTYASPTARRGNVNEGNATSMRRLIGISLGSCTIFACASGWGAAHPGFSAGHRSVRGSNRDHCCSLVRSTKTRLVGKPSRKRTASGEILDATTPTAAHCSLPLGSHAKVTNLRNGCSVDVKINDRGPYARGRVVDLSPRAADALGMKRGVAPVAVEPRK